MMETHYYRQPGEAITPWERTTQIKDISPLRIGVVYPYLSKVESHLDWLLEGVFFHINRPVLFELEEIYELKNWKENNSILITIGSLNSYFKGIEGLNLSIGVVHFDHFLNSCPQTTIPESYWYYEKAKFVLRTNYCDLLSKTYSNVYFLPLGWATIPDPIMTNYLNNPNQTILPFSPLHKFIDIAFEGHLCEDRRNVFNQLDYMFQSKYNMEFITHPISGLLVVSEKLWGPADVYSQRFLFSHFGLVVDSVSPPGIESARFYESLSGGSIPLAMNGTYLQLFDYPFKSIVSNWRRDTEKVVDFFLSKNAKAAKTEERKLVIWWKEYLKQLRLVVQNVVDELFDDFKRG